MGEGVLISVVDDNESLRKAVKRLIECVGLCVEDFASAEGFLNSGRAQDSACLILDVGLPGMSGLELQTRLGASNCRVPIIFISAQSDGQVQARALQAGAVDFLVKPFSEGALLNAINSSSFSQRRHFCRLRPEPLCLAETGGLHRKITAVNPHP